MVMVLMLWSMVLVTGIGSKQWSLVDDVGTAKLVLCLFQIL